MAFTHWKAVSIGALLVAAVVCLALLAGLRDDHPAHVDGGCAPSHSPYLAKSQDLSIAAITYCEQGDADTSRIRLTLSAGALRTHELVVSGYLDGDEVRATVHGPSGEAPVALVQRAGEVWTPVAALLPAPWLGLPLTVELDDGGTGHAQWAGIGLMPRGAAAGARISTGLILGGLAVLALLAAFLARRSGAPPAAGSRGRHRLIVGALAVGILLTAGNLYRNDANEAWVHPDQSIPIKVIQAMHAHGDLNTDFARADIPAYFHEFRYNFSGYILLSYLTIRTFDPAALGNDAHVRDRLLDISRWSAAATLALCLLLLVRHVGMVYGLLGTLAIAVVPQFYQDAHYARLESMSALLFTACFALATLRPSSEGRRLLLCAAVGVLAGLLSTIKFTYAICTLFCIATAMPGVLARKEWPARLQLLAVAGVASLAGFLLGFCAGAPAIVADLHGYLAGIEALNRQYGGGHPPHGFIEPGALKQFLLIGDYYMVALGVPLIALHFIGYARRPLSPAKQAYALILGITFIAFVLQRTFFERNFSPFVPVFVMLSTLGAANLAGWLARHAGRHRTWMHAASRAIPALFVLALLPPLLLTQTLSGHFDPDSLARKAQAFASSQASAMRLVGADRVETLDYGQVFARDYPDPNGACVLYSGISYNDEWSNRFYAELPSAFRIVRRLPSDFDNVPVSTLQPYHSATVYLFHAPSACPDARADTASRVNP